jgi:hypothetical protein
MVQNVWNVFRFWDSTSTQDGLQLIIIYIYIFIYLFISKLILETNFLDNIVPKFLTLKFCYDAVNFVQTPFRKMFKTKKSLCFLPLSQKKPTKYFSYTATITLRTYDAWPDQNCCTVNGLLKRSSGVEMWYNACITSYCTYCAVWWVACNEG